MITIDTLSYNSKLRYYNTVEKLSYSIITLIICVFSRSVTISSIVLIINSFLIIIKSGVKIKTYLRYMSIPIIFLLISTFTIILNLSITPYDVFAIPIGDYYLTASYSGIVFAMRLMFTSLASVSCLYFLSFTTPMIDLLQGLSKLHFPRLFVELMMLIYRFLFILMEIAYNITISQNSRLGYKNFRTSIRSFGMMGVVLFIRSLIKSNRIFDSMDSRCYNNTINVLNESNPPKKNEIFLIVLVDLLLMFIATTLKFI